MIPEPQQLVTTGIPALTADGRRAWLRQVLLSSGDYRLHALVIRYGMLPPRDVAVRLAQVADITSAQVRLRLSYAELAALPAYLPARQTRVAPAGPPRALVALQYGSSGVSEQVIEVSASTARAIVGHDGGPPDGLIALRKGQPVWSGAQKVGRLERLLLDAEGQVRQIVVRTSVLFGRHVVVPARQVTRCDAEGIWLALDRAAFDRLPAYRTDRSIARGVDRALRADQIIRRLDYRSIGVTVDAGVVLLQGHATTPVSRARAERAAREVRGVLAVTNQIVTDGEIQIAVAQALASDERTRGCQLSLHARRGVVFVSGEACSAAERLAAEAVAGSVPHVRAVISDAEELDGAGDTEDQRALFPRVGQEVYAADARLGQVEQLIINPRHRRVTALVVSGWMASTQGAAADAAFDLPPRRERRLAIPSSAVREVTPAAVLLRISADAAARYADLDPAAYALPAAGWQPPYPYTHAEVLLERNRTGAVRHAEISTPANLERAVGASPAVVAS